MIKTILKEFVIISILCAIIIFLLSILFYEYNPISTVIPNKIAYTTPENIVEELEDTSIESILDKGSKVYSIEDSDLDIYKSNQNYDPSKENPFEETAVTTETTETEQDTGSIIKIIDETNTGSEKESTGTTSNTAPITKGKGSK